MYIYTDTAALYPWPRRVALHSLKRALHTLKRTLYTLKRAPHLLKRALHSLKRALHSLKRTLYTIKKALYTLQKALYTPTTTTLCTLTSQPQILRHYARGLAGLPIMSIQEAAHELAAACKSPDSSYSTSYVLVRAGSDSQCVAVLLQCVAVCCSVSAARTASHSSCIAPIICWCAQVVIVGVLQGVTEYCIVLQGVAVVS